MKKLLAALLFFCLCNLPCMSQGTYRPLPEGTAYWVLSSGNLGASRYGREIYKQVGDTVMSGLPYNKLYRFNSRNGAYDFKGGLRNDTALKLVYFHEKDASGERILYDFSLQPGDQASHLYFFKYAFYEPRLAAISSKIYGNETYRLFQFKVFPGEFYNSYAEGIGSFGDLLNGVRQEGDFVTVYSLECFVNDGKTVDFSGSGNACDTLPYVVNDRTNIYELYVYPNPADYFVIVPIAGSRQSKVTITNALGNRVYESDQQNATYIPVSIPDTWPQGFYTVKVQTFFGIQVGKFVIQRK